MRRRRGGWLAQRGATPANGTAKRPSKRQWPHSTRSGPSRTKECENRGGGGEARGGRAGSTAAGRATRDEGKQADKDANEQTTAAAAAAAKGTTSRPDLASCGTGTGQRNGDGDGGDGGSAGNPRPRARSQRKGLPAAAARAGIVRLMHSACRWTPPPGSGCPAHVCTAYGAVGVPPALPGHAQQCPAALLFVLRAGWPARGQRCERPARRGLVRPMLV